MNKKQNPKTELIRIDNETKIDLKYIKRQLKLRPSYGDGDIVRTLVKMYYKKTSSPNLAESQTGLDANHIAIQTTLDEYKSLYDDAVNSSKTWRQATEHLCIKHQENIAEVIEIIKRNGD